MLSSAFDIILGASASVSSGGPLGLLAMVASQLLGGGGASGSSSQAASASAHLSSALGVEAMGLFTMLQAQQAGGIGGSYLMTDVDAASMGSTGGLPAAAVSSSSSSSSFLGEMEGADAVSNVMEGLFDFFELDV